MLKMTIDNEEVLSDNDISIKEEILSPSSTILNNVYPKSWELDKDYTSRFYYPKDYSKLNIQNFTIEPEEAGKTIQINGSATLNDVDASKSSKVLRLLGQTSQVSYSGINLIEPKLPSQTIAGITLTNNGDGSYKIKGTATANASFRVDQSTATGSDNLKDYNGTYTLSCNELTSGMQLVLMDKATYSIVMRMNGNNTPVTATINKEGCFIYVYVANGTTINNLTIKPMLEKSSSASAWQPYVGGIPSPNPSYPQPINVVSGDNYIDICGKNLFDKDNANILSGAFFNNNLTTIGVNTYSKTLYIPCEANTTYTIQKIKSARFGVCTTNTTPALNVNIYNVMYGESNLSYTITTDSNSKYICVFYYKSDVDTLSEQTILDSIQIEVGSTATATNYEPYIGHSYPLYLGVENLFDYSTNILANANIDNVNNIIKSDNTCKISYVKCQPNTTYTISRRSPITNRFVVATTNSLPSINTPILSVLSKNDNTTTSITITTPSNANYIVVRFIYNLSDDYETYAKTIQIEKGSKVNSYSEYGTTPIELCKIGTYQDYIYKDNGSWYLHKEIGKVVLNGSETWLQQPQTGFYRYGSNIENATSDSSLSNTIISKSNYFNSISFNSRNTNTNETIYFVTNNLQHQFFINTQTYTTLTDFTTWLSTHNTIVYYVLANSTNTEITDTLLLSQLNDLES